MQGVTRTLAKELGGKGVRVNCVAPGYIDTEMMRAVGEEKFNAAIARHPMKRMADPSEIASIVAFLMKNGHVVSEIKKNKIGLEEYYIELMSKKEGA